MLLEADYMFTCLYARYEEYGLFILSFAREITGLQLSKAVRCNEPEPKLALIKK